MTRVPAILLADFPGRDVVAHEALRRWAPSQMAIEHVSDGASFTYRFASPDGRRYLRLTPPGWRSEAEVRGELAFIQHLDARGIPLARPVPSLEGELLETVESSRGPCIAVAFEEVRGTSSDDRLWSLEQSREAGRLMARAHLAMYDFALPKGTARLSWRDEFRGSRASCSLRTLNCARSRMRHNRFSSRSRSRAIATASSITTCPATTSCGSRAHRPRSISTIA